MGEARAKRDPMAQRQVAHQPAQCAVIEPIKNHVPVFGQRGQEVDASGGGRAHGPTPLPFVPVPVAEPGVEQARAQQGGLVNLGGAAVHRRKGFGTVDDGYWSRRIRRQRGRLFLQIRQLTGKVAQGIGLKGRVIGPHVEQARAGMRHAGGFGQRRHHQARVRVGGRNIIAQGIHQKRAPQPIRHGPNRVFVDGAEHVGVAVGTR